MKRLVATVVPERRPKVRRTGRDTSEREIWPIEERPVPLDKTSGKDGVMKRNRA